MTPSMYLPSRASMVGSAAGQPPGRAVADTVSGSNSSSGEPSASASLALRGVSTTVLPAATKVEKRYVAASAASAVTFTFIGLPSALPSAAVVTAFRLRCAAGRGEALPPMWMAPDTRYLVTTNASGASVAVSNVNASSPYLKHASGLTACLPAAATQTRLRPRFSSTLVSPTVTVIASSAVAVKTKPVCLIDTPLTFSSSTVTDTASLRPPAEGASPQQKPAARWPAVTE